jgi:phospholipid/cholesterol/gamma-HCH transport system ATP-binding protein
MTERVVLAFKHVCKSFNGRAVLHDVSFEVMRGEALCIVGRSGTGKSVTLKLMIGLLKPDSGEVWVDGENIAHFDEQNLSRVRRKIGFLFQSAALFDSFSLGDNLALPLQRLGKMKTQDEIDHAVDAALKEVGLELDKRKMPVELSGGMRKRAGLARAMVLQPCLLLVDEPSSGLDRITAAEIDRLLLHVKKERHTTMVIVTHDVQGARRVGDKIAVLDKAELIAFGTPEELDGNKNDIVRQLVTEAPL